MTPLKIVSAVVVAVVLGVAIYGGYLYPQTPSTFGSSPQGATAQNAKQYSILGVNLAAPGANATSSSILNNTGQDLFISGIKAFCEGVGTSRSVVSGNGLSALTFTVATTSSATPSVFPAGSNLVLGGAVTIATTTPNFGISTSTVPAPGGVSTSSIVWLAGSYLTFLTNATNTAVCSFGADVTSS